MLNNIYNFTSYKYLKTNLILLVGCEMMQSQLLEPFIFLLTHVTADTLHLLQDHNH